jgi:hypothetical protein
MTRTRNQTSAAAPEQMAANRRKEPPARRLRSFANFNGVDFMFFILSCRLTNGLFSLLPPPSATKNACPSGGKVQLGTAADSPSPPERGEGWGGGI